MRVNCAVLGDELFESELSGTRGTTFAGAAQHGSTVFFDEVVELTTRAQANMAAGSFGVVLFDERPRAL